MAITRSDMRSRVRRRADAVEDGVTDAERWLSDAEIDDYIDEANLELWGILVRQSLIRPEARHVLFNNNDLQTVFFNNGGSVLGSDSIDTLDGSRFYPFPVVLGENDHWGTIGVWRIDDPTVNAAKDRAFASEYVKLARHTSRVFQDENDTSDATSYRLSSKGLELNTAPVSGVYLWLYIPMPPKGDIPTELEPWADFVVVDAARKVLDKERTDSSHLLAERERIIARVHDEAVEREIQAGYLVGQLDDHGFGYSQVHLPPGARRGILPG